jgi:hypothetical protein
MKTNVKNFIMPLISGQLNTIRVSLFLLLLISVNGCFVFNTRTNLELKDKIGNRSRVNDTQSELKIENSNALSGNLIQKFGKELNAGYIILGNIRTIADSYFPGEANNKEMQVSIRIVSTDNSELIGAATYSDNFTGNVQDKMDDAISNIVKKLEVEVWRQ